MENTNQKIAKEILQIEYAMQNKTISIKEGMNKMSKIIPKNLNLEDFFEIDNLVSSQLKNI